MKKYIIIALLIVIYSLITLFVIHLNSSKGNIKLSNIRVENSEVLKISKNDQKKCLKQLVAFLNKKNYYDCNRIVFLNNTFDTTNNDKYFYVVIAGYDYSLIEITNLYSGRFKFKYIGNKVNESTSSETGVSYLQIVDPKEYKKQLELKEIAEEGKNATPDSDEITQNPEDVEMIN